MDVLPYIAAALTTILTLVLFVSVKRDLHTTVRRKRQRFEEPLGGFQPEAPAPSPSPEPVYVPVAIRPGLNVNRRVHAMRMLRRGDEAAHIAAVLGIPRREVELLVRVQAIAQKRLLTPAALPADRRCDSRTA